MGSVFLNSLELYFWTYNQGRNEWGKGDTIPWAPNHRGGPENYQQCRIKKPFSTAHLLPKDLGSNIWAPDFQTCFFSRAPSNLVTPLLITILLSNYVVTMTTLVGCVSSRQNIVSERSGQRRVNHDKRISVGRMLYGNCN